MLKIHNPIKCSIATMTIITSINFQISGTYINDPAKIIHDKKSENKITPRDRAKYENDCNALKLFPIIVVTAKRITQHNGIHLPQSGKLLLNN